MRLSFLLIIFCSLFSGPSIPVKAAELSVVTTQQIQEETEENENSPMQFLFIAVILILMLLLVAAGAVLTVLALLAFFGLITLGLVSSSMAVGLYRKSLKSSFRTLVIIAGAVAGGLCGILVAWFVHLVMFSSRVEIALPVGAVGGVLSGILFGFLAVWIIRRLSKILNEQFQKIRGKG